LPWYQVIGNSGRRRARHRSIADNVRTRRC
jgi:hypothetical protein